MTADAELVKRLRTYQDDAVHYGSETRPLLDVADEAAAAIERLTLRAEAAEARVRALEERKDAAYEERNRVVALLANLYPATRCKTAIAGWSADWHGCVYIVLPTGQVSWHYHDSHAHLFAHVPEVPTEWDGHTTEEKYERVARAALKGE